MPGWGLLPAPPSVNLHARVPRLRRRDMPLDPEECFGTDRHRVDPCLHQEARKRRVIGFDEGDESAMKRVH